MFEHLDYLKDEVDLEAQNIEGTRFYRVPSMDARSLSNGVKELVMKKQTKLLVLLLLVELSFMI